MSKLKEAMCDCIEPTPHLPEECPIRTIRKLQAKLKAQIKPKAHMPLTVRNSYEAK